MNKIATIIFDFGNTVAFFDHIKACCGFAKLSPYSVEEIYERIFKSELEQKFDEGKITSREFFQLVKRKIKLDNKVDFKKFRNIWCDIFSPNPETEKLIKRLKKEKYRLVLLSNTNKLHVVFFREKFSILKLFNKFIFSYTKGYCKPDLRMWTKSGEQLENCIYIDDIEEYAKSSEKAGVRKGFHYDSINHGEFEKKLLKFLGH